MTDGERYADAGFIAVMKYGSEQEKCAAIRRRNFLIDLHRRESLMYVIAATPAE